MSLYDLMYLVVVGAMERVVYLIATCRYQIKHSKQTSAWISAWVVMACFPFCLVPGLLYM